VKKTFSSYVLIWSILFVLFNVLTFAIPLPDKYTATFFVGHLGIVLALFGQLYCARRAFKAENLKKFFYNLSLISLSFTGLVLTFIVGGACMLLPFLPYWVGAVSCLLVLGFSTIAVVKATAAIDAVEAVDTKIQTQTLFIRSLTTDAQSLLSQAQNEEIKAECKKVYEAARYSDPMSHEALTTCETRISLFFNELSEAVKNNDGETVTSAARNILNLLSDRNNKCKSLK